ncbi:DUF637 domain-containing protein [Paraburkholderia sediminicola]|uniref:DUF637 domain-containing protein n=1 Tax=Paraburkholderia sediminicola TaxID=458836 RepID=UPI0038BBF530
MQTAIGGGSFLTNLKNDAVSDVAAAGAYAIGNAGMDSTSILAQGTPGYWLAHAALGCAASAAEGSGCAGGAIGGAASAALSPSFAQGIDPSGASLDAGQRAALAAFATIAGGGLAALAGANVQGATTAAQNEALNNSGADGHIKSEAQLEADAIRAQQTKERVMLGEQTGGTTTVNGSGTEVTTVSASSLIGALGQATNSSGYTYDATNPGPLPDYVAGNFAGGRYSVGTVDSANQVFFKAGDANNPGGSYFSFDMPQSIAQTRIDNAVKPYWIDPTTGAMTGSSPINSAIAAQFPKGTTYYYGPVGTQGGVYLGGQSNIQIYVPNARSIGTFTPIAPLK